MKPKLFLFFALLLNVVLNSNAQNPLVKQWDARFGGTSDDYLQSIQQTKDGGFILGGTSFSGIGGDKTQPILGSFSYPDYWIVKIDSVGNKKWDKDFGGDYSEYLTYVKQTSDGGYILGGYSYSDISGDKTVANWDTVCNPFCTTDFWIIKIDSLGNKQWDKDFGGVNNDILTSLQQTMDGGYILGGSSFSGISGDKTQANWDTTGSTADYWIVKTNSFGNKQWDKRFGGTNTDALISIQQTTDGGYILGGSSLSGISGDKTQANRDSIGSTVDYWIVKTDSLGNKQWDKDFGGINEDRLCSLQQTSDRGYILGGYSLSDFSGDKTQASWGGWDYWILKTDSLGNKQWDKDFGGTYWEDDFGSVSFTNDGGYLIAGTSYSNASGDKTENNLGQEQSWIIKIDSLGIKNWDKTIFTVGNDEQGLAIQAKDGCYVIANSTNGGIGGYKTQANWDTIFPFASDYWIIKFCDSTLTTSITNLPNHLVDFSISPNPFTSEISFTIQKQNIKQASFTIKNILGQTVFAKQENNLSSSYTKTVDLGFLPKGIYFVDVTVDGERMVRKIVKE